jgi:hypothetical protein
MEMWEWMIVKPSTARDYPRWCHLPYYLVSSQSFLSCLIQVEITLSLLSDRLDDTNYVATAEDLQIVDKLFETTTNAIKDYQVSMISLLLA